MMYVHYRPGSGDIALACGAAGTDEFISHVDGCVVAKLDVDHVDVLNTKVDDTVSPPRLVSKTADEIARARLPHRIIVDAIIASELAETDAFVMPLPPDRPTKDLKPPEAWLPYRQALRDLSKCDDVAMMIAGWPARPDGRDPIAHFRS